MRVAVVSALAAGTPMSSADALLVREQKSRRGQLFFSDLIWAISHHYFGPASAEAVWQQIVGHEKLLSTTLGRSVGIVVSALDYLSNVRSDLHEPTLMSEAHVGRLATLAMRDGMTGLFNHSACYELLDLELRNRRRHGTGVSLLMVDIDDFKEVNDREGHQRGDRLLVEVARELEGGTRSGDICCRFGGDEFALILRQTNDPDDACTLAERLRARIARICVGGRPIAASIGVAVAVDTIASSRALIERADRALYQAKTNGKNRVVCERCGLASGAGLEGRGPTTTWRTPARVKPARPDERVATWEDEGGSVSAEPHVRTNAAMHAPDGGR